MANKNPRGTKHGGKKRKQKINRKRTANFKEGLNYKEKEAIKKWQIEQAVISKNNKQNVKLN